MTPTVIRATSDHLNEVATRSAMVYASAEDQGTRHAETEPLSGADVLPGFTLSLAEIFQQADSQVGR